MSFKKDASVIVDKMVQSVKEEMISPYTPITTHERARIIKGYQADFSLEDIYGILEMTKSSPGNDIEENRLRDAACRDFLRGMAKSMLASNIKPTKEMDLRSKFNGAGSPVQYQ